MVVARGLWGGELLFDGYRVPVLQDESYGEGWW
jgi:hypothetical protein